MIFAADSECSVASYLIEGWVTIPQVSLVGFCVALLLAIYGLYKTRTQSQ